MSHKCSALFCKNKYKNSVSLFNFPKNENDFKKWVNACCKTSLLELYDTNLQKVKKEIKLCENHFCERDIIRSGKHPLLKRGAIPREVVELKIPKTRGPKRHNIDHSKLNYVSIQETQENLEKEFCEIILEKNLQTDINSHDISDDKIMVCQVIEDSLESYERAIIHICDNRIPSISFPLESIYLYILSSRSPFNDNNDNIAIQGSNQTPNNSSSKDVPRSCNSNSSICSHHISFIEEKAKTYKLEKQVSQLKEENRLQKEEISLLKEKIEILENIKQEFSYNNSNTEENMRPQLDGENILGHSYDTSREVKIEVMEDEEMY